jgi:FkbM family methyltransferase
MDRRRIRQRNAPRYRRTAPRGLTFAVEQGRVIADLVADRFPDRREVHLHHIGHPANTFVLRCVPTLLTPHTEKGITNVSMDVTEFVSNLYWLALGRAPDGAGLQHWKATVDETGDLSLVLSGILGSDEYRRRHGQGADAQLESRLVDEVRRALGDRPLTIVDVGAQLLAGEDHVYEPLRRAGLVHRVIGFEPLAERILERESAEGGSSLTLLPHAIGDGSRHTLHVNNVDATSSLFPLDAELCAQFEHLDTLETVDHLDVDTHRLDEVLPDLHVDFLKLDIQGAELGALEGASRMLTRTAVLHCEVEFGPIYRGQPLFADVARLVEAQRFSLIDLVEQHRYAYRTADAPSSPDRLLWAEAVWFRDTDDPSELAVQAFTAWFVYRKPTLAAHLLDLARQRSRSTPE